MRRSIILLTLVMFLASATEGSAFWPFKKKEPKRNAFQRDKKRFERRETGLKPTSIEERRKQQKRREKIAKKEAARKKKEIEKNRKQQAKKRRKATLKAQKEREQAEERARQREKKRESMAPNEIQPSPIYGY